MRAPLGKGVMWGNRQKKRIPSARLDGSGGRSSMPRMLGDEEIGQIGFHSDDLLAHNLEKGGGGALLNSDPGFSFWLGGRHNTKKAARILFCQGRKVETKKGVYRCSNIFLFSVSRNAYSRPQGPWEAFFPYCVIVVDFLSLLFLAQEWHS